MNKQDIGQIGEKLAKSYLRQKGFHILDTNFRSNQGEIDIIAEKKKITIFVEVRTKTSADFGHPEESITERKKNHLIRTALGYLDLHKKVDSIWRIDFVAVELDQGGKMLRIEHFENAISE